MCESDSLIYKCEHCPHYPHLIPVLPELSAQQQDGGANGNELHPEEAADVSHGADGRDAGLRGGGGGGAGRGRVKGANEGSSDSQHDQK